MSVTRTSDFIFSLVKKPLKFNQKSSKGHGILILKDVYLQHESLLASTELCTHFAQFWKRRDFGTAVLIFSGHTSSQVS